MFNDLFNFNNSIKAIASKDELTLLEDELKKQLENNNNSKLIKALNLITKIKEHPNQNPFILDSVLAEVILCIVNSNNHDFDYEFEKIENLYHIILPNDDNDNQYEAKLNLFIKILKKEKWLNLITPELYQLFTNKANLILLLQKIEKLIPEKEKLTFFLNYCFESRQYFVDEIEFISHLIVTLKKIELQSNPERLLQVFLKELQHRIGIYNLDQTTLEEIDHKLNGTNSVIEKLDLQIKTVSELLKSLEIEKENFGDDLDDERKKQLGILQDKADNLLIQLDAKAKELLRQKRLTIQNDKDSLIREINDTIQTKLNNYSILKEQLNKDTEEEINRIRTAGNAAAKKINNALENINLDQLQNLINSEKNLKTAQNLDQVFSKLTEDDWQKLASILRQPTILTPEQKIVVPDVKVVTPTSIFNDSQTTYDPINHFFDKKIPFTSRINELKEKIAFLEDTQNIRFHPQVDTVLRLLMEECIPYLYGPSGSGKNYLVKMIAELLNLDYLKQGRINEEYDIVGYNNPNGVYQPTQYYHSYKLGGMIFYDEFDSGFSNATIKLNSILSEESFVFPNNELVYKHPNFRMIAAGNTVDGQADESYTARNKMDESIKERIIPVSIGYNEHIEKNILKNYPEWYKFIVNYRQCLDMYAKEQDNSYASGNITTRDISTLRNFKDDSAFSDDEIIKLLFIQAKDLEYLSYINNYFEQRDCKDTLTKSFKKQVKDLFKEKGIR